MLQFRQGDVGFIRTAIPIGAKRIATRPLALGEVTGHSHRAAVMDAVEMFEIKEDGAETKTFLRVTGEGGVSIVHEEHGTVALPEGWEGEVIIAREYDEDNDFRRVAD